MKHCFFLLILLPAFLLIISCSSTKRFSNESESSTVLERSAEYGEASFYAHGFHGKKTASGEIYDMNKLTAAHPDLPFGTKVKVTNLKNNQSVVVRINDRMPSFKGRKIDLSYRAAKEIDMVNAGVQKVKIEILR